MAVQTHGHIDIVIPNAGITERLGFEDDELDGAVLPHHDGYLTSLTPGGAESGEIREPNLATYNTNLLGTIYCEHVLV